MYREILDKQIASAMKEGNHTKLIVWRSIKSEFVKFQTSSANAELTDEKELQIITKMAQQRKDAMDEYIKAKRTELAKAEEEELAILTSLLPQEPTEDDIDNAIKEYVATLAENPTMKDMRNVMANVKSKYPTVNGGLVSKIFKEKYI
jgi:uncharacterized protein YqeY